MDPHDDRAVDPDIDSSTVGDGEHHAIGAVGGAIVAAAAERIMHSDDDAERARAGHDHDHDHDANVLVEDRANDPETDPRGIDTILAEGDTPAERRPTPD